jgi:hypothetical protein
MELIHTQLMTCVYQPVEQQVRISGYRFAQQINPLLAGCSAGPVRACAASGFLNRGAQTIYRIIYPAAIGARIDYEMHMFPRHGLYSYPTQFVCTD